MNDSPEYLLRWHGREIGPCSVQAINRMLDDHEIGLGHEIQCEGTWMSLEEFLATVAPTAPKPESTAARVQGHEAWRAPASPPSKADEESRTRALPNDMLPKARVTEAKRTGLHENAPPAIGAARPRHRLIYALLAILFGFAGVHNCYARHWLTGLFQVLLSIATYLLGFGVFVPWLWALVEAIAVRRDGEGREMV